MAPCAIALQKVINVCYQYSNKIDLNFKPTKSFCVAFTPKFYTLSLPPLFKDSLIILYAHSINYVGFICRSNNCDYTDIVASSELTRRELSIN